MTMPLSRRAVLGLGAGFATCFAGGLVGPTRALAAPTALRTGQISTIDYSGESFDKNVVMLVEDKPFFFNGTQIRDDWIRSKMHYPDSTMAEIYKHAAQDGFTAVNSQINWTMIQPDQIFTATESTYIAGGANADTNFASSPSMKAAFDAADPGKQALAYFKFDFSTIDGGSADASKIRIYVNSLDTPTANLHLYGLAAHAWNASSITWNQGAPNHDGYEITGTPGIDYVDIGGTPAYDPVNQVAGYDFDVTDYLNNIAYKNGKIATFVLKADSGGASVDSIHGTTFAPQLLISRADVFDWTWADKVIGWAEAAELKLELLWFGSQTTKVTGDNITPYYIIRNYEKMQTKTGNVLVKKTFPPVPSLTDKTVYQFMMSLDDPHLREVEYAALNKLFNFVGARDRNNGSKHTVIGCQIVNEPGGGILGDRSYSPYSNALYQAGGYTSSTQFMNDSFWTFSQNLGKAVKDSPYPVYTRINFHSEQFNYVYRNEEVKAADGITYVDFVGYDPYLSSVDEAYRYGLGLWDEREYEPYNYGKNLPMVMETNAARSNSDYMNIATIAGGAIYNTYQYIYDDTFALYKFGFVPANPNVAGVVATNHWLKKFGHHLATKQPENIGGQQLMFFNERASKSALVRKSIRALDIEYQTSGQGVGVAIELSSNSLLLASKTSASFKLVKLLDFGPIKVENGYCDSAGGWISTGSRPSESDGSDVTITMDPYSVVRIETTRGIPARPVLYAVNDDFDNRPVGKAPAGWSISTDGGAVDIAAEPGALDRSLRINRTAPGAGRSYAEKTFNAVEGKISVTTRVRKSGTNERFAAPYLYDSKGNLAVAVAFDASGNITYQTSTGDWKTLQAYNTRSWYQLDLTIDTVTSTVDVYVNGAKLLAAEPLTTPAATNVARIIYYTEDAPGTALFDRVQIATTK